MLQQVCDHIHNYFIKSCHVGTYAVAEGVLSPLPPLKEGQRFWIVGSDLNDGVYTYHSTGIRNDDDTEAAGLQDETWSGTVCSMAVPPAVIELSAEINSWVAKYGDAVNSPYQSESVIGVYSYSKKQSYAGSTKPNQEGTWQDIFSSKLNRWRKVSL